MRAFNPSPLLKLGQLKQVSKDCVQVIFSISMVLSVLGDCSLLAL